jgi:hydroxyacylglutathione hydrolase
MVKFRKVINDIYILETPFGGVWSGIVLVMGNKKVLIDSGGTAEIIDEYLIPALNDMGLELKDISYLLNTHCHGDHIGGHYRIKELSNIRIACFEKSHDKIKDPLKYSKLIRARFPEYSPAPPPVLLGVEPDELISEGEVVAGRLRLVRTPGHDDDAVCWYDINTRSIISGDSLQGNGTVTQGIALYMDLCDYESSLSRLMEMDIENIITAHPYTVTGAEAIGREASVNFLKKCCEISRLYDAFIHASVMAGETDVAVIAKRLIEYTGGKMPDKLFLAMYTVQAHMNLLKNSS